MNEREKRNNAKEADILLFSLRSLKQKKMRESTKMDKWRELNENMCHKTFSVNFLTSFSDPYNYG